MFPASVAQADRLDEIRQKGTLLWGGDQQGGAPFVFPDPEQPGKVKGFEVEIGELIAKELGVEAEFFQGDWANLPLMLNNPIDIVMNGYELLPERALEYGCSRPYYVYGLQLMAKNGGRVRSWEDVLQPVEGRRLRINVLGGTAAERYLIDNVGDHIDLISYATSTDCLRKVAEGADDATLQDDTIAIAYADEFPSLHFVGRPVGAGYYVILVDKRETRLLEAINHAIGKLIESGQIKDIYDRWDLSGRMQVLMLRETHEIPAAEDQGIVQLLERVGPLLWRAAGMTVFLSVVSMPIAMLIGVLAAIIRLYGPRPLAAIVTLYVEVIRGTPLIFQLYVIFFMLPALEIHIPALPAAIIGLSINYSAYQAEIFRAGLQAIPKGQWEASLALGMSRSMAIRRTILPQAIRIVIPPITNDFIALFKDTSVCSVVTVVELSKQYNILAQQNPGHIGFLALVTAILYLMMSYPLALVANWSERRLRRSLDH